MNAANANKFEICTSLWSVDTKKREGGLQKNNLAGIGT